MKMKAGSKTKNEILTRVKISSLIVTALLVLILAYTPTSAEPVPDRDPGRAQATAIPQSASVMFIENVGQFASDALFQVSGGNSTIWLAEDAMWLTIVERSSGNALEHSRDGKRANTGQNDEPLRGVNIKLGFVGAAPHPRLEPFDRLDTHVSYFTGNAPEQWHADVPVWRGVRYVNIYPGVDLEVSSKDDSWTWQFIVRDPQFAISNVRLRVEGADALTVDSSHFRFTTPVGDFTLPLPSAEEGILASNQPHIFDSGCRVFDIASPFSQLPSSAASLSTHDASDDLVYSTFLGGGAGADYHSTVGHAIAVDGAGNAYVTGQTTAYDFPTTPGAFDTSFNGYYDIFVTKLNANGTGLVYSAFLGGDDEEDSSDIIVDGTGNAYITGLTESPGFPTTRRAFDTTCGTDGNCNSSLDAFVVKINPTGTSLVYSTFLGGERYEEGKGIAIDAGGAAYVTGGTNSHGFPTTPGAFDTDMDTYRLGQVFVTKFNPTGIGLVYSTFLGGWKGESGEAIAVDEAGNAYVTGSTSSNDFPTTWETCVYGINSPDDAFVTKLNPTGTGLVYSTCLHGWEGEWGYAISVDGIGNAYVTGSTESENFPTTPGAFDTSFDGSSDGFVAKLNTNAEGTGLVYSTFLGGVTSSDIDVSEAGSVYISGHYGVIELLNANGTGMLYSNSLSGGRTSSIVADGAGNIYVTGSAGSDFPTTPGAFDTSHSGFADAFVAKLAIGAHSISGQMLDDNSVPIAGVQILVNGKHAATTSVSGQYTIPDLPASTYVLTPTKANCLFTPLTRTVSVPPDTAGQDFEGHYVFDISGRVLDVHGNPSAGVAVSAGLGHSTVTDVDGSYIIKNLEAGTYTIAPSKSGCTFTPSTRTLTGPPDAIEQDFEMDCEFDISGRVLDGSHNPFPGVQISADDEYWATTDASGAYAITDLQAGTYTLTPILSGYTFWPATRVATLPPDTTGQSFTVLPEPVSITLSLSGTASIPTVLSFTDTQGLVTTLQFPAGVVTTTTIIVLTPTLAWGGTGSTFAGHAFEIEAYRDNILYPDLTFRVPVTVTIRYSNQDMRVISDESQLALLWWTGHEWQNASQTCDSTLLYPPDVLNNVLSLPICHSSLFALFGPTHQMYLPLTLRNY